MLHFPNCKINLGLYVTGRREDGYHNIETVFYPLPLCDVLEIIPGTETRIQLSGIPVAGNKEDNLVWVAYRLLLKAFPGKVPALNVYLHKAIPMGAGLGGGSADGACMLRMINDYCNLGLSNTALAGFALQLGSDCPFFIYNTPQYAAGRGEQMQPVALDLSRYSIQLICPQVHVSTGAAFKMIQPKAAAFDLKKLNELPLTAWKEHIGNDFELPVFQQHPVLVEIKAQLYGQGALYAAMSGSGSTVFGIFNKEQRAAITTSVPHEVYYLNQ
jgi:4-diphosphocytidyl-2-C-methyl-D-erythritol kinase